MISFPILLYFSFKLLLWLLPLYTFFLCFGYSDCVSFKRHYKVRINLFDYKDFMVYLKMEQIRQSTKDGATDLYLVNNSALSTIYSDIQSLQSILDFSKSDIEEFSDYF